MKKTKVVCTMGPNTNDRELMRKLIQNGMDVARFNFSHGDHEEQKGRMDMLKELREEEHATTAILLDTKGPEIRTGVLKDGKKIKLETGKTFTLTTEDIVGDENKVSITYKGLAEDVSEGKIILIDDGLIGLKVIGKTDKEIQDTNSKDPDDNTDEHLMEAIDLVVETGQASTSFIQRKFNVGYARAGRIIDQMEERGIISGYQGSKPRQVLMSKERWEELKMGTPSEDNKE